MTTAATTQVDDSSAAALDDLGRQLAVTRLIVQKVLIPSVVLFGVSGNLVNVAVLTRRSMKSSTNSYLTALAVCDILYLVFALTMTLNHYEIVSSSPSYRYYRLPFGRPLTDTASNTGIWLTLTFTVERYIGVCHPMKGKVSVGVSSRSVCWSHTVLFDGNCSIISRSIVLVRVNTQFT